MFKSRPSQRAILTLLAVALASTVLAACGGDGSAETTVAPASTTQPPVTTTLAPGTIAVTLTDVSANSMLLTPSAKSTPAGTVTFVVTNKGNREHEFVVLSTDLAAADLPFDETADEALEEGEGVTPIDEIPSIQAGETLTLVVDLPTGHYALICNLEGHYRMGMWSDFDAT
jgi:uncharacterized cupredoxin-like copper-binding protein